MKLSDRARRYERLASDIDYDYNAVHAFPQACWLLDTTNSRLYRTRAGVPCSYTLFSSKCASDKALTLIRYQESTNNSVSGNTEPLASSALADGIAKMGRLEDLSPNRCDRGCVFLCFYSWFDSAGVAGEDSEVCAETQR
jgi:hypothetical protein